MVTGAGFLLVELRLGECPNEAEFAVRTII